MRGLLLVLLLPVAVGACVSPAHLSRLEGKAPVPDLLLLGEQHDVPAHQEAHRRAVADFSSRGLLAAVALEMAERGTSTAGLSRDADEAAVRRALRWDDAAWPWPAYAPAIMIAVAAGVTVIGANLPRSQLRGAMSDLALDAVLPGPAFETQRQAIRAGHCGLLPEAQVAPMARVQIARDRSMAEVMAQAAVPGKTAVLLTGAAHANPALGVPHHLPPSLRATSVLPAPAPEGSRPAKDYCAELRHAMPALNPATP